MSKTNYLRKRVLALFLALAMCLSLVQVTAFASEGEEQADAVITDTAEQDTDASAVEEDDENTSNAEETSEDISQKEGANEDISGEEESNEDTSDEKGLGEETSEEEEANEEASEEEESEEDASEEETPADDTLVCICETKCGEGSINEDCPVCGAEDADLTACEGEEVPAEVPAQVQAFLDAVAALPAPEDIPEEATEAEYEELRVLVETCQDAYDALTYEDTEREDVMAAIETMGAVIEAFCGIQTLEENGTGITWDAETKTLTAIGNGTETLTEEMLTEEVGAAYKDTVKHLIVDGYSIGPQLFMGSPALESVQLSNVKEISYAAFQQDTNLTEFVLNSSDDTKTVIGNGAFSSTAIRDLTLSNAELKNGSFGFGKNLTMVTLNNCDIVGLTVFGGCENLTAIELNNSNVTGNEAFSSITNLSSFSMTGGTLKAARVLNWAPKLTSITLDGVHVELYSEQQGDWYPLNGLTMGTDIGEEKLKVTIKNSTLTKECLCNTVADELYLENVTIPDNTWPFSGTGRGELKVTIEGGSFGQNAFWGCNMKTLTLKNVTIADDKYPFSGASKDSLEVMIDGGSLGQNAFWNSNVKTLSAKNATIGKLAFSQASFLTEATLENVDVVGQYAFWKCPELTTVTFSNTDGKKTSIGDANTSCYTFQDCSKLATINGIEHLSLVGGRAFEGCTSLSQDFITALANSDVILGYSSIFKGNAAMEARMKGILGGRFNLDLVPEAEELKPEGWTSNKTGEKNSTEPDSNQITKEAKWHDADKTVADVQLQFSHSDKPGMDFLFILDLSDSMARIGNGDKDSDSRYYSMQSKMLDVVSKIVEADKAPDEKQYSNQVAFVTFGGYVNDSNVCHIDSTNGFTDDPSVVAQFDGLEALSQNTDYVAAFTEAQKLVNSHDSSRKLAVIFISDGRPTREGTTNLNTVELINSTIEKTANIAEGFESNNVEVFGVLQSVPNKELKYAEDAMKAICTDGLYFNATDTQEFSDAVNKAIGAAYGTYTIVDTVGEHFYLDKSSIKCSENTEYEVSEDGKTITWTIYGLPFTTYTLSFQEKLHDDLVNHIGTHTYDTNDGDATVNGDVNTVETPQLERTVNPNQYTVTVNYYLAGTTTPVPGTSPHTERLTEGASYNVTAYDRISVPGYTYSSTEGALTGIMDGNKVINVYYTQTVTLYRYRIDHVYYRNGTVSEGSRTGDVQEIGRVPDIGLVTSSDYQRTYNGRTYGAPRVSISNGPIDGVYVITLRYNRTTTPTPGPDPDPDPTPVTPRPTPIPDDPTPLSPGPDGTTIPDQEVPLAAPGLNSVDHYAYIIGYPDGLVHPEANVTRAEVATIFFRLMTDEFRTEHWATENPFLDVAAQEWFNNSVSTSSRAGIVKGYEDGSFRPNNNITRAEFAAIAARFLSDEVDIASSFSDISGHWAEKEIDRAVMAGWIKGYTDGTFRPDQPITRAEAVTMINRMLDRTPDKDHMLENMIRWDDNTEDKWYYADMQEATNSHDYERLEMVLIEDWTELLENRDWAALQEEWATAASAPGGEVADNLDLSKIGENGVAQDAVSAEPENA